MVFAAFREYCKIVLFRLVASHLSAVVSVHVRFVNDLRLNQFFDNVFKCDQADRLVERITVTGTINAVHEGHVTAMSLLEALKHHVQCYILEHKVTRILIEFAQCPQRCIIVRIDEGQVLNEQHCQNVLTVAFIHRNTREARLHDLRHRLKVKDGVVRQHEGVLNVRHHVRNGLLA